MPLPGSKSIPNIPAPAARDGLDLSAFGGGPGPSTLIMQINANGIEPPYDEGASLQTAPGDKFDVGALDGGLGVITTWVNSGNDKLFFLVGGTDSNFVDGIWAKKVTAQVAADNFDFCTVDFLISWQAHDLFNSDEFPNDLTGTTTKPTIVTGTDDITQNKTAELTFSYPNTSAENPTSIAVVRRHNGLREALGSIAWVSGKTDYVYTDKSIIEGGSYEYSLMPYRLSDSAIGPESISTTISFPTDADIDSSGGIDVGYELVSRVVILADPSGIYTFVPDKTHDTLYNRPNGIVTSVDIEIPEPIVNILL